jgi:general secretion pathway protein C
MQNIKYHLLNIGSVILFSYTSASTMSDLYKISFAPVNEPTGKKSIKAAAQVKPKSFDDFKVILNTNFFRIAKENPDMKSGPALSNPTDIQLLGTITGPPAFARALIKKKTDKDPLIFKIGNEVYGYKLVRIDNSKTYLKAGKDTIILDMFAEQDEKKLLNPPGGGQDKVKQSISRAEMQQMVLNDIDNALSGIKAGPYRVNNKIEGFKLFSVSPNNVLYKLGARSGDIVKRINGHPLDSTEKLYKLWQSVQGESKISIDLERGGKLVSHEFNITN